MQTSTKHCQQNVTIVTRFAPSPTGSLHIGSVKMALFNWLYARHHGGKFMLRIEDTDKERSTDASINEIFRTLEWLSINYDGDPVIQSSRQSRHQEVVDGLLLSGKAYKCYCSQAELEAMREDAGKESRAPMYDKTWRDKKPADAPSDIAPTVRLRVNNEGKTTVHDKVQGSVSIKNDQIDDMVLLRSDGTPTYLLAVVVDDHDMGITHIIRGDEHFVNTFRQYQIYDAMGWDIPVTAHIPLIHGADGGKLSKRHGAASVDVYKDQGIVPQALLNYLLRLGWAHGNDEIISMEQAIKWFDFDGLGKSPAKFDEEKLLFLNAHYLREMPSSDILKEINISVPDRVLSIVPAIAQRAKTLNEIREMLSVYISDDVPEWDEGVLESVRSEDKILLQEFANDVSSISDWSAASLENFTHEWVANNNIKLGAIAKPLRATLTGKKVSPGIFDVLAALGKEIVQHRISKL